MSAVDVEDVGEAVLQHAADGVVVGQVVVLPEVAVLVEVDGVGVGGEHVQVHRLAVVQRGGGDVLLQAVQQQGAWGEPRNKDFLLILFERFSFASFFFNAL